MTVFEAALMWRGQKTTHTATNLIREAIDAWPKGEITEDRFLEILAKVGLWANVEAAKRDQTAPFYVERMRK